jgi:hypothetical protein
MANKSTALQLPLGTGTLILIEGTTIKRPVCTQFYGVNGVLHASFTELVA